MEHTHPSHRAHRIRRSRPAGHLLTIEQFRHLLAVVQDHPLNALLTLAITTGLRRGELLGLTWQDLEREHQLRHVRRMVVFTGKGERTDTARTITLPSVALHALQGHHRLQENIRARVGEIWQEQDLVFPDACGHSLTPSPYAWNRTPFSLPQDSHL